MAQDHSAQLLGSSRTADCETSPGGASEADGACSGQWLTWLPGDRRHVAAGMTRSCGGCPRVHPSGRPLGSVTRPRGGRPRAEGGAEVPLDVADDLPPGVGPGGGAEEAADPVLPLAEEFAVERFGHEPLPAGHVERVVQGDEVGVIRGGRGVRGDAILAERQPFRDRQPPPLVEGRVDREEAVLVQPAEGAVGQSVTVLMRPLVSSSCPSWWRRSPESQPVPPTRTRRGT